MDETDKEDRIKTTSVIRNAHESTHEVVNISLADYLSKPKIERTGLYLIGIAVHSRTIRDAFSIDNRPCWIIVNFRTGKIVMQGSKKTEPTDKELERIQLGVGEVCFVYDQDVLSWL